MEKTKQKQSTFLLDISFSNFIHSSIHTFSHQQFYQSNINLYLNNFLEKSSPFNFLPSKLTDRLSKKLTNEHHKINLPKNYQGQLTKYLQKTTKNKIYNS